MVLAAVVLASGLKTLTGMGFGLITIPLISLVVGVEEAVASVALANVAINGGMAWHERSAYPDTRDLPTLTTTAVVGSIVGTVLLVSVPDEPLVVLLAAVVFAYVTLFFMVPDLSIGPTRSARLAPLVGTAAGFLHGTTGISGPIVGTWIHAFRLDRNAHILSATALYLLAGFTQAVVLIVRGSLNDVWPVSLAAVIPAVASIRIGRRFRDRISPRGFDLAVVITLAVSAVVLLVRTFT